MVRHGQTDVTALQSAIGPCRIAFVDLLFSWPPHGGADLDLYQVLRVLQAAGHHVHLYGVHSDATWERGAFDPPQLPFPATRLDIPPKQFNRHNLPQRLRIAVDAWRPDAVFLCDAFFLKPYLIQALAHYPLAARYYAYEAVCHRDILRFKDGSPCPNDYLSTPDICRRCALDGLAPDLKRSYHLAWLQEYLAARAFTPEYHRLLRSTFGRLKTAIVYNDVMKQPLEAYCASVHVVPGGVDPEEFPFAPWANKPQAERKIVLMTGRGEDPVKGAAVLREAGDRLARERNDFQICVTMPLDEPAEEYFTPIGWCSHHETKDLYQQADICVVPSIWHEPFGMVALEAMATGRPICASRVGGLQHIVRHTETGFLFEAGDSAELAQQLALLLDNPDLRRRMGEAGRRRVEDEYTWDRVIARYYPPILEELTASTGP